MNILGIPLYIAIIIGGGILGIVIGIKKKSLVELVEYILAGLLAGAGIQAAVAIMVQILFNVNIYR